MAKRAAAAVPGPTVVDAAEGDFNTQPAIQDEEWIERVINPATSFFDALTEIPEGGWDKCSVYLYRLDPQVSNKDGDRSYIAVFSGPITEAAVQKKHGGGKYQAYLKYEKKTLRNHRFRIEGDPILIEGQTLKNPGAVVGQVMPSGGEGQIAGIVRQVIEATKGDPTATNAGIDIMRKAMQDGLEISKEITKQQIGSTTGSPLGDKLVDALLPKLLNPQAQPAMPPIMEKFMEAAIKHLMSPDRREPNPPPAATSVNGELGLLKDLLGVENIRELMDLGTRGKAQPWWVGLISNAIDKLPSLLTEFAQMQERGFQRALAAHNAMAGRPVVIPPGSMPRPFAAAPPPPPGAAPANGSFVPEQMIASVITGICEAYDGGYSGDVAAAHIRLSYPQLVETLKPLLTDPTQLSSFVGQVPELAERAKDTEWAQFQREFVEGITEPEMEAVPAVGENSDGAAAGAPS